MKCIDINYVPSKLCVYNDELWVGGWDKGVFVYNLNLQQTNDIEHHKFQAVTSVLNTPTGVIVCDCNTGVHHLNHQGDFTNLICSGRFSDACLTSNNKIYALEGEQDEIYTFVRNQNSWARDTQFKLINYNNGGYVDKLCTTSTHLYVSSCKTNCVLVYTLSGEYLYKTGGHGGEVGKFDRCQICDVDSEGKLLVSDCDNHRLQVFDNLNREWTELSGLKGAKSSVCAEVGDKHIWVCTQLINKLLKIEAI